MPTAASASGPAMFLATPKTFSTSFKPTTIEIQARHHPVAVHTPPRLPRRALTYCPGQFSQIVADPRDSLPLANLLVARGGSFFASSRPTLPFTSTLVLRMRRSRVRRFLSEYPAFDSELS